MYIDISMLQEEKDTITGISSLGDQMITSVYNDIQELPHRIVRDRGYTVVNKTQHRQWPQTAEEIKFCQSPHGILLGDYFVCPDVDPLGND